MKTFKITINLCLFLTFLSFSAQNETDQFIGKWEGEADNEIAYLTFDSEGYAYFEINGKILGGKEFEFDGKKGTLKYEVIALEEGKFNLDLVVTYFGKISEVKKLMCIGKFIDFDHMIMVMGYNDVRPTSLEVEDVVNFKRVKN